MVLPMRWSVRLVVAITVQILLLGQILLAGPVLAAQTNITSLCSPHATPPKVTKGEKTYVCLNVNDKLRTVFMPVADQFTVLRMTDSWNDTRIGGSTDGAYLTVSSGAFRTFYKLYSSAAGRVYSYVTAIISVKQGVIQGVTWDDGCYFCDAATCEPNLYRFATNVSSQLGDQGYTCYNSMETTCKSENSSICDLTVYVGWTGTDSKGNYLSSAGMRMSQFKKYSIGSFFTNLASTFSALLPTSRFEDE